MKWIKSEDGVLINADQIIEIRICDYDDKNDSFHVRAVTNLGAINLSHFYSKVQALVIFEHIQRDLNRD